MEKRERGFWWGLLKLIIISSVVFGFFGAVHFLIPRWWFVAFVVGLVGIVAIWVCVYLVRF